jgi:hypothetical protein
VELVAMGAVHFQHAEGLAIGGHTRRVLPLLMAWQKRVDAFVVR